jgi:HAD superfamily hydrolase (TIGR01549 family)
MTKLFDAFIFDIDGTLTSTNQLIFDSFNFIAKKYLNKTFTDDEIISMFGPPENDILKRLCGENYESARKDYFTYYSKNHWKAELYSGIKEILEHLKSKNYPIGIFTGKGRDASLITLKKLGVDHYFDLIVTGDDVENHKPSPEGILKFVNHFKLKPDRVLMIGDSASDVKASREAGIKIASVLWDSYGKEEVKTLSSDYYFHTVEELREFLLGTN